MVEAPIRICGNCVYWGDGTDYCPYTMNLYQAYEPGCVNHITVLELDADYRRMVGEEVANAEKNLMPCPFCGNKHIYADTNCSRLDNMLEVKELQCSIVCRKCGARTAEFSDLEQAVEAWNRRAE